MKAGKTDRARKGLPGGQDEEQSPELGGDSEARRERKRPLEGHSPCPQ